MNARLAALLLLPAVVAAAACNEIIDPELKPRLELEMRADSLGLYDSMSFRVRFREDGEWTLIPNAYVESSDPDVVGVIDHPMFGRLLVGNGLGNATLRAYAAGMEDSVRVEVKLLPIRAAGFILRDANNAKPPFHDPDYYPVDGTCFTFTAETFRDEVGFDAWPRQIAGWVVDGLRQRVRRGTTEWTVTNPGIFDVQVAPDSINDLLILPSAHGYTLFEIRDGPYTGAIQAWVDLQNGCQGIVPGTSPENVAAGFVPEPVYVW